MQLRKSSSKSGRVDTLEMNRVSALGFTDCSNTCLLFKKITYKEIRTDILPQVVAETYSSEKMSNLDKCINAIKNGRNEQDDHPDDFRRFRISGNIRSNWDNRRNPPLARITESKSLTQCVQNENI
jgi:hypothetical protein